MICCIFNKWPFLYQYITWIEEYIVTSVLSTETLQTIFLKISVCVDSWLCEYQLGGCEDERLSRPHTVPSVLHTTAQARHSSQGAWIRILNVLLHFKRGSFAYITAVFWTCCWKVILWLIFNETTGFYRILVHQINVLKSELPGQTNRNSSQAHISPIFIGSGGTDVGRLILLSSLLLYIFTPHEHEI